MDRKLAEELMRELIACREAINSVELISRRIPDEAFRKEFRTILGRASLDLYSEAMGRIILRFPELDPYCDSESGAPEN